MEKIFHYGSPVLREKAEPVTDFGQELRDLAFRMEDTLYEGNGVGLAAPQVGVSKRFVLVDLSFGDEVDRILFMANPEILESEGECVLEEGCLSVPGVYEDVPRAERIRVKFQDLEGNMLESDAEGYLARIMQHEIDHLNGILFIDRIDPEKKLQISDALREIAEKEDE